MKQPVIAFWLFLLIWINSYPQNRPDISIEVCLPRQAFFKCQPTMAVVFVKNNGSRPLEFYHEIFEFGKMELIDSKGNAVKEHVEDGLTLPPRQKSSLLPGKEIWYLVSITRSFCQYNSSPETLIEKYLFPSQYTFTYYYQSEKIHDSQTQQDSVTFKSNSVTFTIDDFTEDRDKRLFEEYHNMVLDYTFAKRHESIKRLQDLIKKEPNSRVLPQIYTALTSKLSNIDEAEAKRVSKEWVEKYIDEFFILMNLPSFVKGMSVQKIQEIYMRLRQNENLVLLKRMGVWQEAGFDKLDEEYQQAQPMR